MNNDLLYPLIPQPINVRNDTFSGKLLIDGNMGTNTLLFRFMFDTAETVAPLCIHIGVLEKVYRFFCTVRDFTNPVMKTLVLNPEFSLEDGITIQKVEPFISYQ